MVHPSLLKESSEDESAASKEQNDLKWEIEFDLDSYRFHIKFNEPVDTKQQAVVSDDTAITAQQVQDAEQAIYKHYLVVDKRISVMEFKLKVCQYLDVSLSEIIFRRGGSHGTELLEDDDSLKMA